MIKREMAVAVIWFCKVGCVWFENYHVYVMMLNYWWKSYCFTKRWQKNWH